MSRRLALILALLAVCPLYARTHVWKGTASNLFSDPRNWSGGSPAGDPEAELVFPEAVRQAVVNDLDGLTVRRMTFEVDGYRVEGKAITLVDRAEIENRDADIAAELRLNGEVVQNPPGAFTRYIRDEGHAPTAPIHSDAVPSDVITFGPSGDSVDAHVTPGAETAWLILSRNSLGAVHQGYLTGDSDRDGIVRWENQWFAPARRKVCVIDLASGEIHAAISDGSPVERGVFAAKFLRDPNGNFSWIEEPEPEGRIPEILWVRPGVGAWFDIPSPLYGHADTLLFNVRGMRPLGASPAPPAGVEPGDYFISMTFSRFENGTFYGGRVDEALENAERAETKVVLNSSSMEERYGNAFFFVLRFGSTDRDTRIEYEISDADADDGVVYPSATGTLVIRRGEVLGRIEYPIAQDAIYTGGTLVQIDFKSFSGGTLIGPSSTLASLVDDDRPPGISVVSTSVAEGDAGTRNVPVELKRDGGTLVRTTVRWGLPLKPMQTIVFAPGETHKEILLQVHGDTVPEPNEEIRIDLDSSPLQATVTDGTLTVVDDDAVGITPRSITVTEASGVAKVVVALDSAQLEPVTVKYQTSWQEVATPGADYTAIAGTLAFAPGEIEKQVVIPILQDRVTENPESFELILSGPSPNVIIRQRGRITILDDGDFPDFLVDDVVTIEGEFAELFVAASPAPQTPIRVGARSVSGSAAAGVDFKLVVEDGDFDPANTWVGRSFGGAFLYVGVFEDDVLENDETFVVEVFDIDNPSRVLASATVTVNDATSLLPVLTIGDSNVSEGKTASFRVALSSPSADPVAFRVRTVADTAESNIDYQSFSQLYTFAPGETSLTLEIVTLEDGVAEPHETFAVELLHILNARIGDTVGRGRIFDDDDPEAPVFEISNISVSEGAGVARFTVTLERALSRRTSISFATSDGTATAGEDYLASHGELTFEPGETSKTIEIALVNDARFEEDETFTFRLGNGFEAIATIVNDDVEPARRRSARH
jgi:hypothetical protein